MKSHHCGMGSPFFEREAAAFMLEAQDLVGQDLHKSTHVRERERERETAQWSAREVVNLT